MSLNIEVYVINTDSARDFMELSFLKEYFGKVFGVSCGSSLCALFLQHRAILERAYNFLASRDIFLQFVE